MACSAGEVQRGGWLARQSGDGAAKGGGSRDTKIELGFSMSLRRATPGIRPEGRRLGTLRLGRRLDPQKIGLNPRAKVAAVEVSAL